MPLLRDESKFFIVQVNVATEPPGCSSWDRDRGSTRCGGQNFESAAKCSQVSPVIFVQRQVILGILRPTPSLVAYYINTDAEAERSQSAFSFYAKVGRRRNMEAQAERAHMELSRFKAGCVGGAFNCERHRAASVEDTSDIRIQRC